jgi:hypothetical protein
VRLSATSIEVLDGPWVVALHERVAGKYAEILSLDHYLEVLKIKPGALPGATALAQAKASGAFTATHQRYWDAARRGPAGRDEQGGQLWRPGPQVVLIDARREAGSQVAPVIPIGTLARYDRPTPSLTGYDDLLTGSGT